MGTVRMVALNDLDLDAVRAELEARRDRDRERLGVLAERPELGSAVSFGKRIGDGTSEAASRLTDIGVGEALDERGLDRTERAVAKPDEGTYGVCDVCGGPISRGRLKAMPDSAFVLGLLGLGAPSSASASSLKAGSVARRAAWLRGAGQVEGEARLLAPGLMARCPGFVGAAVLGWDPRVCAGDRRGKVCLLGGEGRVGGACRRLVLGAFSL